MKYKSYPTKQQKRAKRRANILKNEQAIIPATKTSMFQQVIEYHQKVSAKRNEYFKNFTELLAQCKRDMENLQKKIKFPILTLYEDSTKLFFVQFKSHPNIALDTYYRKSLLDRESLTGAEQMQVSEIYNRTIMIAKLALRQSLNSTQEGELKFSISNRLHNNFFSEKYYQPTTINPMPPPMAIADFPPAAEPTPTPPSFIGTNSSQPLNKRNRPDNKEILESPSTDAAEIEKNSKAQAPPNHSRSP